MSGAISIRPSSAAILWAPAFTVKFSSVQVRPARNQTTGTFPFSAAGGRKAAKRMGVFVSSDACRQKVWVPPKQRCVEISSRVMAASLRGGTGSARPYSARRRPANPRAMIAARKLWLALPRASRVRDGV